MVIFELTRNKKELVSWHIKFKKIKIKFIIADKVC